MLAGGKALAPNGGQVADYFLSSCEVTIRNQGEQIVVTLDAKLSSLRLN
jgi:hypothetical protein